MNRFFSSVTHLTPANLFLLLSTLLGIFYIIHYADLSHYPHGKPRFLHSVHLAVELLGGPADQIPESFVDTFSRIQPFPNNYMAKNICNTLPPLYPFYCHPFPANYQNPSFRQLATIPLNANQTITFIPHPYAGEYAPLGYIPYVLAALIGLLLALPPIIIFYLGVTFNTLIAIALGYYTLRLLPLLAWPLCYLLLLPGAFLIRIQVMPDAITLELCLLALAFTLNLAHAPRLLTRNQLIGLLVLAFCIGLIKFAYFLVPLAYYFIPASCFAKRRIKYAFIAASLTLAAGAGMGWAAHAAATQYPEMLAAHQRETDLFLQTPLATMLVTPFHYLGTITGVIASQAWVVRKFYDLVLSTWQPFELALASAPLFLLTLPRQARTASIPVSWRFTGLTVFFGTLLILCVIMLFHRPTPWPENPTLIQGRYLLPVLPFLLLTWYKLIPLPEFLYHIVRGAAFASMLICLYWLHSVYLMR